MLDDDDVLGPKELVERGLAQVFGPSPTTEVTRMAITGLERPTIGGEFVPKADVTETLPDGRTIQIAVKGRPIPMSEAIKAGLVKGAQAAGPAETKPQAGPTEVKNVEERGPTAPDEGDIGDEDVDAEDTNPPPTPTPAPKPTAAKKK